MVELMKTAMGLRVLGTLTLAGGARALGGIGDGRRARRRIVHGIHLHGR